VRSSFSAETITQKHAHHLVPRGSSSFYRRCAEPLAAPIQRARDRPNIAIQVERKTLVAAFWFTLVFRVIMPTGMLWLGL
jgi:hypothetical protein